MSEDTATGRWASWKRGRKKKNPNTRRGWGDGEEGDTRGSDRLQELTVRYKGCAGRRGQWSGTTAPGLRGREARPSRSPPGAVGAAGLQDSAARA